MRLWLVLIGLLFLSLWGNPGWAQTGSEISKAADLKVDLEQVRRDLAKIDAHVSAGALENSTPIVGETIKARDVYRKYLAKAAEISEDLITIRQKLDVNQKTLSLQHLGALSRSLSAENAHFKDSFKYGEDKFQTYQLIEKAVYNLEDAIRYWQLTNRYRWLYRGSNSKRAEDDTILKIKLQTAINAIDELKLILETRESLAKNLDEHN